ncbi:Antagonist of mitotic exit network protein 1 [Orchesella cincta]|uniref:Antagonist of mitotic exit network protein 1 n=1 Tax=Orchesella cincta TaxID=48709 RepID=A0A1D2MF25_ORCCI|nr:Antagonist of mitotic exit network protein 1 [Orchesella cincta]
MPRTYSHRNCKAKKANSTSHSGFSTSKKTANMNDIPPEILNMILGHLDNDDLKNCRKVNPQWEAMSDGLIYKNNKKQLDQLEQRVADLEREYDELQARIRQMNDD